MAKLLITRIEGVRRLAALAVILSLFLACEGPPGGPSPPTALAVSSVAPNTATIGTTISIVGSGFRTGVTVAFGGVKAEVLSLSSSSIVARTPELAPGRVDIVVTDAGGKSAILVGGLTIVLPPPFAVTDSFPRRGYGDMLFGLRGTGLSESAIVKFGGVRVAHLHYHPTGVLNGLLPPHAPGPVDITVTHPDGRSLTISNGLTYVPAPVLTASPETVTAGGSVTLSFVTEENSSIDYISLFPVGGQEWDEMATQYVIGKSGTMTFLMPSSPGRYEFRYLPHEGQWGATAARSNVVTVTPASAAGVARGDAAPRAPANLARTSVVTVTASPLYARMILPLDILGRSRRDLP